jgi:hypothetical protein
VTDFVTAGGSFQDFSGDTYNCIQGTTGADNLRIDEQDDVCLLGGNDTVTVERPGSHGTLAYISAGNGTDTVNCQGGCYVFKTGFTGSATVKCDYVDVRLDGGGGQDTFQVFNDCESGYFDANGNDDLVEVLDCTALTDMQFIGGGGSDTFDENGTPGCTTSDYTTSGSWETTIP